MKELGRQVYLGGYEHEEHAAEAYDVAALKCKGFKVKTNFDIDRQAARSACLSLSLLQCKPFHDRECQSLSVPQHIIMDSRSHPEAWEDKPS